MLRLFALSLSILKVVLALFWFSPFEFISLFDFFVLRFLAERFSYALFYDGNPPYIFSYFSLTFLASILGLLPTANSPPEDWSHSPLNWTGPSVFAKSFQPPHQAPPEMANSFCRKNQSERFHVTCIRKWDELLFFFFGLL